MSNDNTSPICNFLIFNQIQENILKYLPGSDVLKCRILSSTWMQNCSNYLRKDNKIVIQLYQKKLELFIENTEKHLFSDFILDVVSLEINDVNIKEEMYAKFLSLYRSPKIRALTYAVKSSPGCLRNLVLLLKSSCNYFENLELTVLPLANFNTEILQQCLRGTSFCKLNSIRINDAGHDMPSTVSEFLIDIISSSPNLKSADLTDCSSIALSLALKPKFTLRTLYLWFHRSLQERMDGQTLSLLFHQLAPSLEELHFQPKNEDQVSALDSVCFQKVTNLRLSSQIVFVYPSRICKRNFPALKRFDPYYHCIGIRPPHLAEDEVAIAHPHEGVKEIKINKLGQNYFYNKQMQKSISSLVLQFPFVTKYCISEECSASLLLTLCSSGNSHVREIILDFSSAYEFPQEYFTGVWEELLQIFETEAIPEDSDFRTFPSIGDIPNLETLELYRCSDIPYCVVRLGLVRIKNLKKLRLPKVPDLSLRFIADNFGKLESLTLEKVPGEAFNKSDVEYIKSKLPDLALDLDSTCRCVTRNLSYN